MNTLELAPGSVVGALNTEPVAQLPQLSSCLIPTLPMMVVVLLLLLLLLLVLLLLYTIFCNISSQTYVVSQYFCIWIVILLSYITMLLYLSALQEFVSTLILRHYSIGFSCYKLL